MNFLEKDLEEIIYGADRELLAKKGLHITGKLYRQLRIGNYGVADLISVKRKPANIHIYEEDNEYFKKGERDMLEQSVLIVTIYELKKEKIGISAFLQAIGYARGIRSYLSKRNIDCEFKIVLIGKEIDKKSTYCYLSDILNVCNDYNFLKNYTYKYSFDGISFEEQYGYKLTDEGFKL